ncbi:MAG: sodium-dependent transporter [Bacteroidia bacterium]|nr:sodium-dependent transporter [Bacteroidia bacterium]MDW8416166.1 sodium-dependent transporter [Bacteroidia bacterium]
MEKWSGRIGALLALIGGAVGLGNFLRFPFQAAKWGGGAFLIPYLVALVAVGLPLVWMEMALGRAGAQSNRQSAPELLHFLLGRRGWYIGLLGVYVSMAVGAYYAYLTGWTLGYTWHAVIGTFRQLTLEKVVAFHGEFIQDEVIVFWLITWIITGLILYRGLRDGLEAVNLWGMPMLFLLGLAIAIGAVLVGNTGKCPTCDSHIGVAYLYAPRWAELKSPAVWLAAVGQVFFSIGVGFAMYPVYAASAERLSPIRAGTQTVLANTIAEIGLGGLIVIPLVTAFLGLDYVREKAGFGLGFAVMPYVLNEWGGRVLIMAWYILLFLAAISSLIAMGWVGVTWLSAVLGGEPRRWTFVFIIGMLLIGFPAVWGYQKGTLDLYDQIVGTVMLILAGLGHWWAFHQAFAHSRLREEVPRLAKPLWRLLLRWMPPLFLGGLLVGTLFQPVENDWLAAVKALFQEGRWPWAPEGLLPQLLRSLRSSFWNVLGLFNLILLGLILIALRRRP